MVAIVCGLMSCSGKSPKVEVDVNVAHTTVNIDSAYFHTQGLIFHTQANIKYKYKRSLGDEIFARLDSFDLSLNPFNEKSIIAKVNKNESVEVDDWFIRVFNKAMFVSETTGGMYDITSAPLVNAWGFGYEKMGEVDEQVIDSLKEFVGYEKLRLDGRRVIKTDPRVQLNASSLAKGFAVDVVADLLELYGIADYMVEIGGEVRARGLNPKAGSWRIGISKPEDDNTGGYIENQEIVALDRGALATSGNYRNYYIKDGKKITHTINPITGYPSETDMLSATVIYSDCITADAYATAFMAMGSEASTKVADEITDMQYLFIYKDKKGEVQIKENLK